MSVRTSLNFPKIFQASRPELQPGQHACVTSGGFGKYQEAAKLGQAISGAAHPEISRVDVPQLSRSARKNPDETLKRNSFPRIDLESELDPSALKKAVRAVHPEFAGYLFHGTSLTSAGRQVHTFELPLIEGEDYRIVGKPSSESRSAVLTENVGEMLAPQLEKALAEATYRQRERDKVNRSAKIQGVLDTMTNVGEKAAPVVISATAGLPVLSSAVKFLSGAVESGKDEVAHVVNDVIQKGKDRVDETRRVVEGVLYELTNPPPPPFLYNGAVPRAGSTNPDESALAEAAERQR